MTQCVGYVLIRRAWSLSACQQFKKTVLSVYFHYDSLFMFCFKVGQQSEMSAKRLLVNYCNIKQLLWTEVNLIF